MNHALIDHLNAEQIADEKREAEALQHFHGRTGAAEWELWNRERHPTETTPECPIGEQFHFYNEQGYCVHCQKSLRGHVDAAMSAIEFLADAEPIPYDIAEGIILESKDNL